MRIKGCVCNPLSLTGDDYLEKLDFLINYLLKENKEIKLENMPTKIEDKKNLWRSLCNIRDAKPISNEYLQIENEYLRRRIKK